MRCATCGCDTSNWLAICDNCAVIDYLTGPHGSTIEWPVPEERQFLFNDDVVVKIGLTEIDGHPYFRANGLYVAVGDDECTPNP